MVGFDEVLVVFVEMLDLVGTVVFVGNVGFDILSVTFTVAPVDFVGNGFGGFLGTFGSIVGFNVELVIGFMDVVFGIVGVFGGVTGV